MSVEVQDLRAEDIPLAARTFIEGFRQEPMFDFIFRDRTEYERLGAWMFGSWMRWAIRYGKIWVTPQCRAVAIWRKPGEGDMSFWSLIHTGIWQTPLRMTFSSYRRLMQFTVMMQEHRSRLMKNQPHWYCQNIAVLPEFQGQGLGRALMRHACDIADADNLACYLETSLERNVDFYRRHGFELREALDFANWGIKPRVMIRPPQRDQKHSS
ncbi:MAG: GNAT family N-acetyltransferase [Planctomycetaceae bacterium]